MACIMLTYLMKYSAIGYNVKITALCWRFDINFGYVIPGQLKLTKHCKWLTTD